MAELTTKHTTLNKSGKRNTKKLSTRVDLTPMVDLGFLLITFFVFTTAMAKPSGIKINLPKGDNPKMKTPESTVLTIIPIRGDSIFYYSGKLEEALHSGDYGISNFSFPNGIGSIIREKQQQLDLHPKYSRDDLFLVIKPFETASYQNITDAIDEAIINGVKTHALVDITKEDIAALPKK